MRKKIVIDNDLMSELDKCKNAITKPENIEELKKAFISLLNLFKDGRLHEDNWNVTNEYCIKYTGRTLAYWLSKMAKKPIMILNKGKIYEVVRTPRGEK